jgi:predicted RND superfamily exporter protein
MFGGTDPKEITVQTNGANDLRSAKAIKLSYVIDGDEDIFDELRGYDEELEDYVDDFNDDAKYIKIYPMTATSVDRAIEEGYYDDLELLNVGFVLLILYSFVVLGQLHPTRSRAVLSFAGIICVAFAIIEAIGLGIYCGFETNGLVSVLGFVLLGIGVDDMYVLVQTIEQIPISHDIPTRINYMMKHAGTAITITSFTSLFSFAISASTSLPALSEFCGFASFGIFFNYLNQITMFSACIVLDERRMKRPCGDCCGLCLCPAESAVCCRGKAFIDKDGNERQSILRTFLREKYGPFLMRLPVKIAVVVIFLALFGTNLYGAT